MKNNTEEAKMFLNQSLKHLPSDYSLSEVRNYIKMAIEGINKVESKRIKRENLKQKRLEIKNIDSNYDPNKILFAIEREIDKEKLKLQNQSDEDILFS